MIHSEQRYTHWLNNAHLDQGLRQELESVKDNAAEIEERFYTQLSFGTGGLRGEVGAGTNRMNIYTIRKATLGLSQYVHNLEDQNTAKQKSVVIAYDCRHMSPEFAEQAALTLAQQGIRAYLYPTLRSTPQLSYSVLQLNAEGGIMITASHNPPEYNGFKAYGPDGAQLNIKAADQVIRYVNQIEDELTVEIMAKNEALEKGLLIMLDQKMDQSYFDYVSSLTLQPEVIKEMAEQFSILFTPLHGTGLYPVQNVLEQVGFKNVHLVEEQMMADPNFSTVKSPNPEESEAFELAIQYARKHGADIIMGTDPDADRMGVVVQNNEGEFQVLTGNQTGALLLHYILSRKQEAGQLSPKDTICKTIVTSELGRVIGDSFGVQTIDTLTGFKFIGEKIKEFHEQGNARFLFGYEESYGYLIGDGVRDKDAIQAVLLAAEMGAYYKSKGMTIFEALQELYQQYGFFKEDLISITLKGKDGVEKIASILRSLREEPLENVASLRVQTIEDYQVQLRLDVRSKQETAIQLPESNVLKYFLEDGTWFCVRPSGTEPKLKIYIGVKGSTAKEATEKQEMIRKEIEELIANRK